MSVERLEYAKSCFESDGFKSGEVVLPGLNLNVKLKPNQYFRYDGIVSSIPAYIRTLPKDVHALLSRVQTNGLKAFSHDFVFDGVTGFIVVVQDVSPRVNIHNEAHEAAEVAYSFGLIDELEQHLSTLGANIDLQQLLSRHDVGVVAGYIQAKKNGFDLSDMYREQDPEGWLLLKRFDLV